MTCMTLLLDMPTSARIAYSAVSTIYIFEESSTTGRADFTANDNWSLLHAQPLMVTAFIVLRDNNYSQFQVYRARACNQKRVWPCESSPSPSLPRWQRNGSSLLNFSLRQSVSDETLETLNNKIGSGHWIANWSHFILYSLLLITRQAAQLVYLGCKSQEYNSA